MSEIDDQQEIISQEQETIDVDESEARQRNRDPGTGKKRNWKQLFGRSFLAAVGVAASVGEASSTQAQDSQIDHFKDTANTKNVSELGLDEVNGVEVAFENSGEDQEDEYSLQILREQIDITTSEFHLDFQQPYTGERDAAENFILDIENPIQALESFDWQTESLSRDELIEQALAYVDTFDFNVYGGAGADITDEVEFFRQFARDFPVLALSLPQNMDIVETRMLRGEFAGEDTLTLLNPTLTSERSTYGTLMTLIHESKHYFNRLSTAERLSTFLTMDEYVNLISSELEVNNDVFRALLQIDTYQNPQAADNFFRGYLGQTPSSIGRLLGELGYASNENYDALQYLYEYLGLQGNPYIETNQTVLLRVVQHLHLYYDSFPANIQEIYHAVGGRLYYDINHVLVNIGPDQFGMGAGGGFGLVPPQELIENPNLLTDGLAELSIDRLNLFAQVDVTSYEDVYNYVESLRQDIFEEETSNG